MLGRTADNLYWMARYLERAENTARFLGGIYRMSLLPTATAGSGAQWETLFLSPEEHEEFLSRYDVFNQENVITYLAEDLDNPSSIRSCMCSARENVRAARHVLSTEIWETINFTWLEICHMEYAEIVDMGIYQYFEWIKERSHMFRGVVHGTIQRGEAFGFWQLGTCIERAGNTARLLAARSDSFRSTASRQEGVADFYHWGTLLRSVNAYKIYREIYRSSVEPRKVAELLLLHPDMPRSLRCCLDEICSILNHLRDDGDCVRDAEELRARLVSGRIDRILRSGLPEFLDDFGKQANTLSTEIQQDFMMVR